MPPKLAILSQPALSLLPTNLNLCNSPAQTSPGTSSTPPHRVGSGGPEFRPPRDTYDMALGLSVIFAEPGAQPLTLDVSESFTQPTDT